MNVLALEEICIRYFKMIQNKQLQLNNKIIGDKSKIEKDTNGNMTITLCHIKSNLSLKQSQSHLPLTLTRQINSLVEPYMLSN